MNGDVIDRIRETLRSRAGQRAIEFAEQWISWGDVARIGERIIALLDAAGCPPDGRIGVIIRNRAAHASAVIGLLADRRSLSFVYPFLPPATLADHIASLGASAIVADAIDWPAIRDAVAATGAVGISLGPVDEAPRLVGGLETCRHVRMESDAGNDSAVEVLSSGTTGPPKRIAMPLSVLERAVQSAPGGEAGAVPSVQINVWPLGGVGGICLLTASAATGTPLVLMERFSVEELIGAIRRHRPPTIGLPPASISMLMEADAPVEDMASLQSVSGGSAYLDPDLQDRFEAKYGIPIYWGMGATEFCGTIARWTPEMRQRVGNTKRGSTGLPMPGVKLRVVDPETGKQVATGQEGLLEVHCPFVRPDWVRTTDLVMIDEDGYLFHRGRHDGAIVRGGFKILPERLVDALRAHPSVADASVIGLPDLRLGQVPVAAVEILSGADPIGEAGLLDHLRVLLPPTHLPTRIRIVDALPRTPSLKVSLTDVRAIFEQETA